MNGNRFFKKSLKVRSCKVLSHCGLFGLELMIRARLFRQFMLSQIQQKGAETLRDSLAFFKLTLGKATISQAL